MSNPTAHDQRTVSSVPHDAARVVGANTDQRFVDYYVQQSLSVETTQRFEGTMRVALALRTELSLPTADLEIVDIGCGAGSQALLWSQRGHRAHGIDISVPLIEAARIRAAKIKSSAQFHVGAADQLPMPDGSADVVLVSELLEHLPAWQNCLDEALRLLRPGGIIYLSTTNKLCPVQQEFTLPAYSWYPRKLKRYCERLATTTHGHWVQFTSLPAVNWFSFYQLRDYLNDRGFTSRDRFDSMAMGHSTPRRLVARVIQGLPPLRYAGHMLTPATVLAAYRRR